MAMNPSDASLDLPVYRAILSSMGEGIVFVGPDGTISFINEAAEKIRGIRAADFLGRRIEEFHAPPSRERILLLIEGLRAGEIPSASRNIHVGGKIFENCYYPINGADGAFLGVLLVSRDITEKLKLKEENLSLRRQVGSFSPGDIIARSPAMRRVLDIVAATAVLDSTIILTGESGTGKELVAREIHRRSPRHDRPLVKVNCAALPETLLEAELFGHEKGSFTGAERERKGKFELADTGTIFLDEIGEIPLQSQAKLLRAIQERTIERVGGSREIRVDVRIVAATNRDLRREVEAGRFREDLFYRLNVIPIHLPPLRERGKDILPLASVFLSRFAETMGKPAKLLSREATRALLEYPFPGNVRELEHALERAVALSRGDQIELDDLPAEISSSVSGTRVPETSGHSASSLSSAVSRTKKETIVEALRRTGNRKGDAAKLLGISRKTLWEKMKELDVT